MNTRKIEINRNKFEVLGDKPWILVPVSNGVIIVDEAVLKMPDFQSNPQRYNALRRVATNGATLPVLFSGAVGLEMASETVFILNQKL